MAIEDFYAKLDEDDFLDIANNIIEQYVSKANTNKILTFYHYKDSIYDETRASITDRSGVDILDDTEPIGDIILRCDILNNQLYKDNDKNKTTNTLDKGILTDIFLDTLIEGLGVPKSYVEDADPIEYAKTETMMYQRGIYGI